MEKNAFLYREGGEKGRRQVVGGRACYRKKEKMEEGGKGARYRG